MNNTERKAVDWLVETTGVDRLTIIYQAARSPDLIMPDGTQYEVKKLYGDVIIFTNNQVNLLRGIGNFTVLVFGKPDYPLFKIPSDELFSSIATSKRWSSIRISTGCESTVRTEVFIDRRVAEAVDRYKEREFGRDSKRTSLLIEELVKKGLSSVGYWPPTNGGGDEKLVNSEVNKQ